LPFSLSLPFFKRKRSQAIRRIDTRRLCLAAGCLTAFVLSLFYLFGAFHSLESRSLDFRIKLRGPLRPHTAIQIVGIDDASLAAFGRWPWPRSYQAHLLDILEPAGVKSIAFDMIFPEATENAPTEDMAFGESLKRSNRTILGSFFRLSPKDVTKTDVLSRELEAKLEKFAITPVSSRRHWVTGIEATLPIPILYDNAKGSGFVNVAADHDGKLRRIPLVIYFQGKLYPSLSLRAVMEYWGLTPKDISFKAGHWIELRPPQKKPIRIPVDSNGYTYINYAGPIQTFPMSSFAQLMIAFYDKENPDASKVFERFKDSAVFVGVTATATTDLISTPYAGLEPGISMQASVANSLLQGKFIYPAPFWVGLLVIFLFGLGISSAIPRLPPAEGFFGFLSALAIYPILAHLLFLWQGWWIPVIAPFATVLITYIAVVLLQFVGERLEKQALGQELAIAQKIQQSFLPKKPPVVPKCVFAADTVMAKEVGGDLYDFLVFNENLIGTAIGDVSGKGVPAALYMAKTISDFRTHGRAEQTPAKVITRLNQTLVQEGASGMFVTFFYLLIDLTEKKVLFSSGGHHPLWKWSRATGEITEHNTLKGKPLGIIPFKALDEGSFSVEDGDLLILYTDGIEEAMNRSRQLFGKDRMKEVIRKNTAKSPADIIKAFQEAVRIFAGRAPQHDDMTLLIVRIGSKPELS
jgi:CHASE2 domain-containing sensor protein